MYAIFFFKGIYTLIISSIKDNDWLKKEFLYCSELTSKTINHIPSKWFAHEHNADFTTARKKSSFSRKKAGCKMGASKCSEKGEKKL